jgi:hypothetical protein
MDNSWKLDEHWKVVNAGGRQVSTTPQQLWDMAVEYFKWCDEHPIKAKRTLTSGKTQGEKVEIEYKRPYSIKGMCLHCNISESYISDVKETHKVDSEFYMVVEKILYVIYTQNLEGAIVDLYNPIMVSKVLNMDKGPVEPDRPIVIQHVQATANYSLSNSENEVLQKLDSEKVQVLKDKTENLER